MKKTELECKNCGANMQLSADKTEAYCPYCKNKILLEKAPTLEEISHREEKISYAKKIGENKAEEEFILRNKKRKIKYTIIISLIIILIAALLIIINYFSLEYMEDPFNCIDVNFLGTDGNGTLEILDNKTCEGFIDIKYTAIKDNKLQENEKIRISATSEKYRFEKKTKEYIVSGLSLYLTNLDELSKETLNKLHQYSYEYLSNNSFGISFRGEIESLIHYKLYLYSNGKSKNILYDVFKVRVKTTSGAIYEKYVIAGYENLVLLNNEQLFSYTTIDNYGDIIEAGDPNEYNAFGKDYAGYLTGFTTVSEFENYLNRNNNGEFTITQK